MDAIQVEMDWRRRGRLSLEARRRKRAEMASLLGAGLSLGDIARELGVHLNTVRRWRDEGSQDGFKRVEITSPAISQGGGAPLLVTPTGYRVEGLGLEELALLLRMLG